jgi:4-hydroxy-tetrahydrodipicolinate synthase
MVYDIPHRTATPIETETLCRLAEHERIVGVKDAKANAAETAWVTRRTDLAYYAGDDANTLPWLAIGGVGLVGTSTHLTGAGTKELIETFERGDVAGALRLHRRLLPLYTGIFRTQGTILVKAAMNLLGRPAGPVRSPLVDATDAQVAQLRTDAAEAGVSL